MSMHPILKSQRANILLDIFKVSCIDILHTNNYTAFRLLNRLSPSLMPTTVLYLLKRPEGEDHKHWDIKMIRKIERSQEYVANR